MKKRQFSLHEFSLENIHKWFNWTWSKTDLQTMSSSLGDDSPPLKLQTLLNCNLTSCWLCTARPFPHIKLTPKGTSGDIVAENLNNITWPAGMFFQVWQLKFGSGICGGIHPLTCKMDIRWCSSYGEHSYSSCRLSEIRPVQIKCPWSFTGNMTRSKTCIWLGLQILKRWF